MAIKINSVADIAKKAGISPKGARAKFRRNKKLRPFDHTKVKSFTPAMVSAAVKFLKADHRNA